MSYVVLARKYRPQTFSEVVGQEHVTRTLKNAIAAGRLGHAFLFSGIRGVGKTSVARILARTLNCAQEEARQSGEACGLCDSCRDVGTGRSLDVVEIDGASNNKVEDVRALRETVLYAPSQGERHKVYIIDEVHMLSTSAFNALLKTLEEPPPRVLFILATTEPHKVPLTIQSRCQRYDFRRIPTAVMTDHLASICAREGVEISRAALHRVAVASEGSLRDAQSLLDQVISFAGDRVSDADVDTVLGSLDRGKVLEILRACLAADSGAALSVLAQLIEGGADPQQVALALVGGLRDLLLLTELPQPGAMVDLPPEELSALSALARDQEPLLARVRFALMTRAEERMRRASQPRFHLELALVHLARAGEVASLAGSSGPASAGPSFRAPAAGPAPTVALPKPTTPAKPIAFDAITTPRETWEELVEFITGRAPHVGSALLHLRCTSLGKDQLVIGGRGGEMWLDLLREKDTGEALSSLVREFFHREMKVRLEVVAEEAARANHSMVEKREKEESDLVRHLKKETMENEVVRAALEVLGGEVEDIRVLAGRGGGDRPAGPGEPLPEAEEEG